MDRVRSEQIQPRDPEDNIGAFLLNLPYTRTLFSYLVGGSSTARSATPAKTCSAGVQMLPQPAQRAVV